MSYDFSKIVKIGNKILMSNGGLVVPLVNGDTPVPPGPEPEKDCILKNNTMTAFAEYHKAIDEYNYDSVEIGITFENSDSYADVLRVKVNGVYIQEICSSDQYVTIEELDFETYNIQKGENTLNVEVYCEDHPSYSLTTTCNVNIPESQDPIEEYTVQGVSVSLSGGASESEAYTVYWYTCGEDWFDENCQYEIVVKHGEEILTSTSESYEAYETSFNIGPDYLDKEEYTFEVRVVKYDKKSLPGIATDTYRDPFHDESIELDSDNLYISSDGDTNGYTLSWDDVCGADKYEVYLDGNLYKTTTSSSISINDKNPDTYDLTIKAYNYKNTMISYTITITLYDPMEEVSVSLDDDITYYSYNETIYIPTLNASYNGNDLPSYIESRLNNKSLEIYIDGDLVKTQGFTSIDDIVVSNLSAGDHTISFTLTTTYGSSASSEDISFNVDRCGLKNNSIKVTASYDSNVGGVSVDVDINKDSITETDDISFTINGEDVTSESSGSRLGLTIYPDDYGTYDITPGQENTIHVEVSCKNGNHDETLSKDVKLYVNSWMETTTVDLEYAPINASCSSSPAVNIFVTLGPGCGGNLIAECEEDSISTGLVNTYGMAENEFKGTLEFYVFEYNTEYTKTIKIYSDTNSDEYIESTITFTSPEEPPKDDEY